MKPRDGFSDIPERLIRYAARGAPPLLSERLQEEWRADLAAHSGAWARVRFGLGCCWAGRVIQHETRAASVPAACATAGGKVAVAAGHPDAAFLSRRTLVFLLILALHAALIYGFASGLVHTMAVVISDPMQAVVTQAPHSREEPPPPPPPTFVRPQVQMPLPDMAFDYAPDTTAPALLATGGTTPARSEPPVSKAVERIVGGPGKGFPDTDDFYPSASRRLGETGVTLVRACVDPRGSLSAEPSIVESSGIARIDQGALKLAKAGSGHYRATTEDGKPVSSCFAFRIRFRFGD
jgi:TonB family protein